MSGRGLHLHAINGARHPSVSVDVIRGGVQPPPKKQVDCRSEGTTAFGRHRMHRAKSGDGEPAGESEEVVEWSRTVVVALGRRPAPRLARQRLARRLARRQPEQFHVSGWRWSCPPGNMTHHLLRQPRTHAACSFESQAAGSGAPRAGHASGCAGSACPSMAWRCCSNRWFPSSHESVSRTARLRAGIRIEPHHSRKRPAALPEPR